MCRTRPSERCARHWRGCRRERTRLRITWKRRRHKRADLRANSRFTTPGSKPAATIDFTGTGPVVDGNLNANRAIVTAAVIYVLRVLVDEDIPLNHGVLRPIEIVLPTCLLNPAAGSNAGNDARGRRRQRGNLAARGRCAAGRARRRGGQSGHDEQRRVWRRDVWLLRNHLRRQRCDGRRARRERRAGAHDQHAADRSGNSGAAISGARA